MKKVKFGVLGISNHFVKRVFFALKKSQKVEIHAIASRNPEKAKAFSMEYGVKKWYPSYEDLLEDDEIEAIYIPLPNHLHAKYTIMASKAGKHVLCEKPLGMNVEEVKRMFENANAHGVLLMEAFMYKFHPQWIRTKEIVESKELGKIRSIECHFSYDNRDPSNIRNNPHYGGGVLLDIGVYAVSVSRFLLKKEPLRVFSVLKRNEFAVDDLVSGILDFGDTHATFTVAGTIFPSQSVDVYGTAGKLQVEIPFNTYPDVPAHIHVTTSIGYRDVCFNPDDHYRLEFEHFADHIRKRGDNSEFYNDSVSNMKVIKALFTSAEKGKWAEL